MIRQHKKSEIIIFTKLTQKMLAQFNEFIENPQIKEPVAQLKKTAKGYLDLETLNSLRDD
jgi:hypothetical protein